MRETFANYKRQKTFRSKVGLWKVANTNLHQKPAQKCGQTHKVLCQELKDIFSVYSPKKGGKYTTFNMIQSSIELHLGCMTSLSPPPSFLWRWWCNRLFGQVFWHFSCNHGKKEFQIWAVKLWRCKSHEFQQNCTSRKMKIGWLIHTIWSSSHHAKKRVVELLHLPYILGLICLELQTLQKNRQMNYLKFAQHTWNYSRIAEYNCKEQFKAPYV